MLRVDCLPGVSHIKASLQAINGDTNGALLTMYNFHREFPGVSQITSLVQLAKGNTKGAKETQQCCLGTVHSVLNVIPLFGQLKAFTHHVAGDEEGAHNALYAANRATFVFATACFTGFACEDIDAFPAGIAAGAFVDIVVTLITGKDYGCVAALKNSIENPSVGASFDGFAILLGSGLAGLWVYLQLKGY